MPKLKTLSGQDVLRIFAKFGFEKVDQEGIHVKIRRQLLAGGRQSLTVPLHDEIDKGHSKRSSAWVAGRRSAFDVPASEYTVIGGQLRTDRGCHCSLWRPAHW